MNPREFCREKGYRFTIILTYGLDLAFFESVGLRDLEFSENEEILIVADGFQVESMLPTWRDSVGSIGSRYRVAPANTPGIFHPKCIIRIGVERAAIWLGSGNLTFGGWGSNQELATDATFASDSQEAGEIRSLLSAVSSLITDSESRDLIERARSHFIGEEAPVESERIAISLGAKSLADQVATRYEGRRFDRALVLTGSTDERGAMLEWLNSTFGVRQVMVTVDRSNSSFLSEKLRVLPFAVRICSQIQTNGPLHAKFVWLESDEGNVAIVGSANCSASGWVIPPAFGGNVELIAFFDDAQADAFKPIIERFAPDHLEDFESDGSEAAERSAIPARSPIGPATLNYDSVTGIAEIEFAWADSEIDSVLLRAGELDYELSGREGRWITSLLPFGSFAESSFVDVVVMTGESERTQTVWVNDIVKLRRTSKNRLMTFGLLQFHGQKPSSEHQRMLEDINLIKETLLEGSNEFPDFRVTTSVMDGPDAAHEQTNPDDFVKSIEELRVRDRFDVGSRGSVGSFGLTGVIAAFFGRLNPEEISPNEDEQLDDFETEEVARRHWQNAPATPADRPNERNRMRFTKSLSGFLDKLADSEWLDGCTARQLQNAIAFPFVAAKLGFEGGWIEASEAVVLLRRTFDIAFLRKYGHGSKGAIELVRKRFDREGNVEVFDRVIGDGTLWSVFLVVVGRMNWSGSNSEFLRKLAMRTIYSNANLFRTANSGRVSGLIGTMAPDEIKVLLEESREVEKQFSEMDRILIEDAEQVKANQRSSRLRFEKDDLLWINGNWAEVLEPADCGENTIVYHHSKGEVINVSTSHLINVSALYRSPENPLPANNLGIG
ncbi:MAG: hypothetical protein IPN69_12460 [Acidobacteria bacterium]|nr:hypothetical protein [Acidobacteriota bacterium]